MTAVNVTIPVSEPVLVRPKGIPASIDSFARQIYAASARYEEFADTSTAITGVRGWFGPAQAAYALAAGRASGEHATLAGTLRGVGHACSGHADTLTDLLAEYERQVDTKSGLDGRRSQLLIDVNAAKDVEPAVIEALRDRASTLGHEYHALVLDHDALQVKVRSNEELMRTAFARTDTLSEAVVSGGTIDQVAQEAMDRTGAPGSGASAGEVENWWSMLTAAQKEAVIAAFPSIIGSADGLPADARDQANRISLDDDLARLGAKDDAGTLTGIESKAYANAVKAKEGLAVADGYEDPTTETKPGGQLWLYDPAAFEGDGTIAIAVGDLDTADDVAVRVPGIKSDGLDATSLTQEAVNVYQSARYNGDGSSVASMMWLGYDAPDGPSDTATLTEARATDGGGRFSDAIEGLRASRPYDHAHLTAIGHSYGSTTVAHAATDGGIDVDDVVLVGSPGAGGGVTDASELGVDDDHVYVGRNSRDIVAALGDHGWVGNHTLFGAGLGNDPSEDDFGAVRFEAEDPTRSSWHRGTAQHELYFGMDSESLYNIGRVVDGSGQVNVAEHTSDPFIGPPRDPEIDRVPTTDVRGSSDTGKEWQE